MIDKEPPYNKHPEFKGRPTLQWRAWDEARKKEQVKQAITGVTQQSFLPPVDSTENRFSQLSVFLDYWKKETPEISTIHLLKIYYQLKG
jgi:hypothetical protein